MTPFLLTNFLYLFILFDQMENYDEVICKLILRPTVVVNNILKTVILIIPSPIFRDIKKLRSV